MRRDTRQLLSWVGYGYFGLGVYLTLQNLRSINQQKVDFQAMAADLRAIKAYLEAK